MFSTTLPLVTVSTLWSVSEKLLGSRKDHPSSGLTYLSVGIVTVEYTLDDKTGSPVTQWSVVQTGVHCGLGWVQLPWTSLEVGPVCTFWPVVVKPRTSTHVEGRREGGAITNSISYFRRPIHRSAFQGKTHGPWYRNSGEGDQEKGDCRRITRWSVK